MHHIGRLPDLDLNALTPEQRAVYDRIAAGPRGQVYGPLSVWVNNPDLADKAQALGQYARYDTSLPPLLSELAILVTARIWSSGFEWAHHAPIARDAGVSDAAIAAIGVAKNPYLSDPVQAAVFAFCVELHRDRRVSDQTYAMCISLIGDTATIDLVGICGYYTLISMTINAFDVPDGTGPALPALSILPHEMFRT